MAIKLHGANMSACTASVMLCLREKGIDFEFVPVNLAVGEQRQPQFIANNPFGLVPVLEDGDLVLFESRAITAFIAEKFKETGYDLLRHQNLKEAALVKVWVEVEGQHFYPAISPIIRQYTVVPFLGRSPDQAIIDTHVEKLSKVLDIYEDKLSKTKYLSGDFYSMADLLHLGFIFLLMKTPVAYLINERPHVKAWWEDVSSRPASRKVIEGIKFGLK